jgi:hypothetical protein
LEESRSLLEVLVRRLSEFDEAWDVIIPVENLSLDISGAAVRIGPVLLVRDRISALVVFDNEDATLGEFGNWAVNHFNLEDPASRQKWSGALGEIAAVGMVTGIQGDHRYAIERAKRDIESALAILRVSYYLHGSWSTHEQFGSFGSMYDPIPRFDVMGTKEGGLRIILTGTAQTEMVHESDELDEHRILLYRESVPAFSESIMYSTERTDLRHPVIVSEYELARRQDIIQTLAEAFWSGNARWSELAIATRLFDEGLEARTIEDAFLKYVIALDVLFGREEKGYAESQITRVSERIAFLLGENDPDLRWKLFRASKQLYEVRSGIVHGGAKTDEPALARMEAFARLAILRMAWEIDKRPLDNLKEFFEWVRNVKFGAAYQSTEPPDFLQIPNSWFESTD